MESETKAVMKGAYWVVKTPYTNVEGKPYLVDTGAEVSMTSKSLTIIGHLTVKFADGVSTTQPYGKWKGIVWLLGPYDLITVGDLQQLNKLENQRQPIEKKIKQLQAASIQLAYNSGETTTTWYKPVHVSVVMEEKIKASDLSEEGKRELREILTAAQVSWFKNDCGDLSSEYTHTITGGVHPAVRQYPLNPEAIEEMDRIVK